MNRKMVRIGGIFVCVAVALLLGIGCTSVQTNIRVVSPEFSGVAKQGTCAPQSFQEPLDSSTYAKFAERHFPEVVIVHAEFKNFPASSGTDSDEKKNILLNLLREPLLKPAFYYHPEINRRAQGVRPYMIATGFIVDVVGSTGIVVTNAHTQKDTQNTIITLYSGKEYPARALWVSDDPNFDAAILAIEKKNPEDPNEVFTPAVLGDSDAVRPGDAGMSIGNPYGLYYSVQIGNIAQVRRSFRDANMLIQLNISTYPGNSGSPVYDLCGRVNNFIFAVEVDSSNRHLTPIGWSNPINAIKEPLQKAKIELEQKLNKK